MEGASRKRDGNKHLIGPVRYLYVEQTANVRRVHPEIVNKSRRSDGIQAFSGCRSMQTNKGTVNARGELGRGDKALQQAAPIEKAWKSFFFGFTRGLLARIV